MNLPNDILYLILTFVTQRTAFSSLIVNRNFHHVCVTRPALWNTTHRRPSYCTTNLETFIHVRRKKKHLCPLCSNRQALVSQYAIVLCDCEGFYTSYHCECLKPYGIRLPRTERFQRGSTTCKCPCCNRNSPDMICDVMS